MHGAEREAHGAESMGHRAGSIEQGREVRER